MYNSKQILAVFKHVQEVGQYDAEYVFEGLRSTGGTPLDKMPATAPSLDRYMDVLENLEDADIDEIKGYLDPAKLPRWAQTAAAQLEEQAYREAWEVLYRTENAREYRGGEPHYQLASGARPGGGKGRKAHPARRLRGTQLAAAVKKLTR